ncbi:olfactory receptor 51B6-like [Phascolarctos cinereus]|uniref:Olfactory receptor 51B6-like n=1 Tax=Phascolarctos cinereus TaxID=38626 RepID=A0A6P5IQV0_PHACI|nr:olfactory receptor 51B6-like [Phascolarctos cinereus]
MWPNVSAAPFLLTGFPGLEQAHHWISIPFSAVYFSVILGNGTLLFLIRYDQSLHEPTYYFLAMLSLTDLGVTLTTMPTVLGVLWLDYRTIHHGVYFLQAYVIHTLSIVKSGVLLAMAYDRFIAIRNPLRHTSLLTNSRMVQIGVGVLLRGCVSIIPPIVPLHWFPYCRSHVLSHAVCLHQDVIKLACADITFNHIYPVILVFLAFLDSLMVLFSYILILKTVLGIASREERAKALYTCVSHISCFVVFFSTAIGLSLIHRFGKHVPHVVHIAMSYVYFLFPPLMNPIIYSIKTKQIQQGILRMFFPGKSRS